jgi:hypothetical protein
MPNNVLQVSQIASRAHEVRSFQMLAYRKLGVPRQAFNIIGSGSFLAQYTPLKIFSILYFLFY